MGASTSTAQLPEAYRVAGRLLDQEDVALRDVLRLPQPYIPPADIPDVKKEEIKPIVNAFLQHHLGPASGGAMIKFKRSDILGEAELVEAEDGVAVRAGGLVRYGKSQKAYLDFALVQSKKCTQAHSPGDDVPSSSTAAGVGPAELNQAGLLYLGVVGEAKRYSRLPDACFQQMSAAWLEDVEFRLTLSRTGDLEFTRSDGADISDEVHSALYFVLEAVSYAWATRVRYGVVTNCLAWIPGKLHVGTDQFVTIGYGRPGGSLATGELLTVPPK